MTSKWEAGWGLSTCQMIGLSILNLWWISCNSEKNLRITSRLLKIHGIDGLLHPIPRSCHPFLKGIRGIPGSFPPKKSILDLSTHSDQPLFFGGGEGKRFMSVNDRFFAPERDQLLCWGHLWPVVQHGSNWVVTSIIASNCFWVAKTLVHNVFLERNPINFHYPIVWQDTTYCITFTGHFQGFLFCPLREYGFNMALLKETNGQWALNRALSLGGGGR